MDRNHVENEEPSSRTRLYFAVAIVNLLYVSTGCVTAWSSPTLPKLAKVINDDQASWISSLFSLGAAFGPIISAFCLDTLGRKGLLNILAGCFLISWIILGCSTNVYALYIGRIIGGIGVGGTCSSASTVVAEVADKKIRGTVGSINMASISLGILIEYCIGPYTSYLVLVILSAIPSMVFLVVFFFIPESPYFLLIKGRNSEAKQSLMWYRGKLEPAALAKEFNELEESIQFSKNNRGKVKTIFKRGPFKALMISMYVLLLQQGSGGNAIISLAETIFDLGHVAVSGPICAIIGGTTNFIASLLTPFIVNKFSIRKTFFSSAFGLAVSLGIISIYFYVQSSGTDVSKISFLPVLGYILYNILHCWGCGALPWVIASELFPLEIKGIALCICGVFSSLVGFAVVELSAIVLKHGDDGPAVVFAFFCIFVLVGTFGAIFIIPNTTGLSLQEIQEQLSTGKRPKKSESRS